MKIVQGDQLPLERGLEHRGGTFHFRRLMEGEAGRLDNFQLSYGVIEGDFHSPRHRHNFEQVRFQLEGELDYSRDGKLKPGMVGYFPEGMSYGPQNPVASETAITVVLQCGGASGSGYMSRDESKAGMQALSKIGTFEKGVFRRKEDVAGKRNMDGFQAIWEHVNRRPMVFPKPRYNRPIFMDPENFEWTPVTGAAGLAEKRLGAFTERGTSAVALQVAAGETFEAEGRAIYFVTGGKGTVDGKPLRPLTTVFLDWGETAAISAVETVEIMRFGLPDLREMMRERGEAPAIAAE